MGIEYGGIGTLQYRGNSAYGGYMYHPHDYRRYSAIHLLDECLDAIRVYCVARIFEVHGATFAGETKAVLEDNHMKVMINYHGQVKEFSHPIPYKELAFYTAKLHLSDQPIEPARFYSLVLSIIGPNAYRVSRAYGQLGASDPNFSSFTEPSNFAESGGENAT